MIPFEEPELSLAQVYQALLQKYDRLPNHKMLALAGVRLVVRKHSFDLMIERLLSHGVEDIAERATEEIRRWIAFMEHLFVKYPPPPDLSDEDLVKETEEFKQQYRERDTQEYLSQFLTRLLDRERRALQGGTHATSPKRIVREPNVDRSRKRPAR